MPEYHANPSVYVAPAGDGALVLLATHAGTMFRLNHTGAALWKALNMHHGDFSLAVRTVSQRYDIPFYRVLSDAQQLVERLTEVCEVASRLDVIDQASRWLPARVACLERSLAVVLWCGLRRRSVCWHLGVRTPPFAAHAWIEIAGHPVGEPVSVDSYLPILSIDSSR